MDPTEDSVEEILRCFIDDKRPLNFRISSQSFYDSHPNLLQVGRWYLFKMTQDASQRSVKHHEREQSSKFCGCWHKHGRVQAISSSKDVHKQRFGFSEYKNSNSEEEETTNWRMDAYYLKTNKEHVLCRLFKTHRVPEHFFPEVEFTESDIETILRSFEDEKWNCPPNNISRRSLYENHPDCLKNHGGWYMFKKTPNRTVRQQGAGSNICGRWQTFASWERIARNEIGVESFNEVIWTELRFEEYKNNESEEEEEENTSWAMFEFYLRNKKDEVLCKLFHLKGHEREKASVDGQPESPTGKPKLSHSNGVVLHSPQSQPEQNNPTTVSGGLNSGAGGGNIMECSGDPYQGLSDYLTTVSDDQGNFGANISIVNFVEQNQTPQFVGFSDDPYQVLSNIPALDDVDFPAFYKYLDEEEEKEKKNKEDGK